MLDQYLTSVGVPSLGLYLFLLIWGPSSKALQLNSGWKLSTSHDDALNATAVPGPGPRAGAALWTDARSRAWLFGGRGLAAAANATQLWADLWLYDAQLQTWQRRIPHGALAGRELAVMCGAADGTIVVFGGRTTDGVASDELLVSRPGNPRFQRRLCSGACPAGRHDALAWCDAGAMHIAGGSGADDCPLADAWTLDVGTMAWAVAKPPSTRCRWSTPRDCNATAPPAQLWQTAGATLYLMCDEETANASTNVQLWARSGAGAWRLEAESGRSAMAWPGPRRHGGACVDSGGDLWLFGGQSQIGDLRYLNNDIWTYSVAGRAWVKAELPSDAEEPAQRHLAAGFCAAGAMWVYGGAACHDGAAGCVLGDLWMLNVSRGTAEGMNMSDGDDAEPTAEVPSEASATPDAATGPLPPPKAAPGGGLILDSGGLLRSEIPGLHSAAAERASEGLDHGAYGSVIFFGISLSMFAVFGLIVFFRRCVSCPPRDSGLLKEAPPVRYTVIPDDAYSI